MLQTLGYIGEDATVALKGRVACEVNSTEELILTELLFEGVFNGLRPEEIAAVLSGLVFQGKVDQEPVLPQRLQDAKKAVNRIAVALGGVQVCQGLLNVFI